MWPNNPKPGIYSLKTKIRPIFPVILLPFEDLSTSLQKSPKLISCDRRNFRDSHELKQSEAAAQTARVAERTAPSRIAVWQASPPLLCIFLWVWLEIGEEKADGESHTCDTLFAPPLFNLYLPSRPHTAYCIPFLASTQDVTKLRRGSSNGGRYHVDFRFERTRTWDASQLCCCCGAVDAACNAEKKTPCPPHFWTALTNTPLPATRL